MMHIVHLIYCYRFELRSLVQIEMLHYLLPLVSGLSIGYCKAYIVVDIFMCGLHIVIDVILMKDAEVVK